MKTWRHYDVLIRGIGGFWTPDDLPGHQERYESWIAAMGRAAYLYSDCGEAEVQVRERTETIIAVWPEEEQRDAEEVLAAQALWHQDAAAAARSGETLSDQYEVPCSGCGYERRECCCQYEPEEG